MQDVGPLPPTQLPYMLELWSECGLSADWQTVQAWSASTGTPICQWEASALIELSGQYRSAMIEYSGTTKPPPYMPKQASAAVTGSILARARQ